MNDLTTSINVPPPRYLLESDSEDEEGQGIYGSSGSGPSRPKIAVACDDVSVHWTDAKIDYEHVVLGTGQAGAWIRRKVGNGEGVLKVQRGEEGLGIGMQLEGILVVDVNEVDNESVWGLATALRESISAKQWTVLTTYLPSMYIPDSSSPPPHDPPIRYLSTHPSALDSASKSIEKLDSPNFITALPAALASIAVHPSTPSFPVTILALPLPLSYVSTPSLMSALSPILPELASRVKRREKDVSARWEEKDDEPYSGPGMGGRKNVVKKDLSREDVGGMYM